MKHIQGFDNLPVVLRLHSSFVAPVRYIAVLGSILGDQAGKVRRRKGHPFRESDIVCNEMTIFVVIRKSSISKLY